MRKVKLESAMLPDEKWVKENDKAPLLPLEKLPFVKQRIQFLINEHLFRDLGKPPIKLQKFIMKQKNLLG